MGTVPSLKHGPQLPDGLVATGVLVHEVRTAKKDVNFKSNNEVGKFAAGKSIRKETDYDVSGDMLSEAVLPEPGSGNNVAGSPHIESTEVRDVNEDASKFSIKATESAEGEGEFGPEA